MEGVIGEIRLWPMSFEPCNWAFCDGRQLSIRNHEALFALIGTTYGGDGVNTFALPDLRGRIPIGAGQGPGQPMYQQGQTGGVENAPLTASQLPMHTHQLRASSEAGTLPDPSGAYPAGSNDQKIYNATGNAIMTSTAADETDTAPQHPNMMPFVCCNYIICLFGLFPVRD
jgi:microcystin-dependent protein